MACLVECRLSSSARRKAIKSSKPIFSIGRGLNCSPAVLLIVSFDFSDFSGILTTAVENIRSMMRSVRAPSKNYSNFYATGLLTIAMSSHIIARNNLELI